MMISRTCILRTTFASTILVALLWCFDPRCYFIRDAVFFVKHIGQLFTRSGDGLCDYGEYLEMLAFEVTLHPPRTQAEFERIHASYRYLTARQLRSAKYIYCHDISNNAFSISVKACPVLPFLVVNSSNSMPHYEFLSDEQEAVALSNYIAYLEHMPKGSLTRYDDIRCQLTLLIPFGKYPQAIRYIENVIDDRAELCAVKGLAKEIHFTMTNRCGMSLSDMNATKGL